jgi:hypothetical protein
MAIDVPTIPASKARVSSTAAEAAAFDQRWAAWQAKGLAHDRAVHRRIAIVIPILLIVFAVVYVFIGR